MAGGSLGSRGALQIALLEWMAPNPYFISTRVRLSVVCLSVCMYVCLSSVTLVRRTQAVQSFRNIPTAFGTLAIR